METFPVQFCRGVRSYWRRRKYQKLEGAATSKKTGRVARLGGGGRGNTRRRFKLRSIFRIRVKLPSPVRLLARFRDAYLDAMLGLAGKGNGLSVSVGPEALLAKRIPKARPVQSEPGEFERRLILEICKSVMASRELEAYRS